MKSVGSHAWRTFAESLQKPCRPWITGVTGLMKIDDPRPWRRRRRQRHQGCHRHPNAESRSRMVAQPWAWLGNECRKRCNSICRHPWFLAQTRHSGHGSPRSATWHPDPRQNCGWSNQWAFRCRARLAHRQARPLKWPSYAGVWRVRYRSTNPDTCAAEFLASPTVLYVLTYELPAA